MTPKSKTRSAETNQEEPHLSNSLNIHPCVPGVIEVQCSLLPLYILCGEILALPLEPFLSWLCGVTGKFSLQALLEYTWKGNVDPHPLAPQTKPGELPEGAACHLMLHRGAHFLSQKIDVPFSVPRPFLLSGCRCLPAYCFGFSSCTKRLVNGALYVPCRREL